MSKSKTQPGQASLDQIGDAEKAGADRLAAEQAEADRIAAEQAEADRIAAELRSRAAAARLQLVQGVMLRREPIEGSWYSAGVVLTLPAELAEQCEKDGAIDTAPAAVEHAIANGAQRQTHTPADPA